MAELQEYQYVVNNMVTTAMLTPEMAKRLGAKPVGSDPDELNGGYTSAKNARVYATTGMSSEVVGGKAVKPVREQQQGIDEAGRTASMRAGTDAEDKSDDDDDTGEVGAPLSTAANKRRTPRDK